MTLSLSESLELAKEFAAHIRNPLQEPAPQNIPQERMSVYRSLFFSSMTGFLDETYEHLPRLLGPDNWSYWQRQFYIHYQAQSPYFHRISSEFSNFIQSSPDFEPALVDLARYEQCLYDVEVLETSTKSCLPDDFHLDTATLITTSLQLNPSLRLERFEYDVTGLLAAQQLTQQLSKPLETPVFFSIYKNKARVLTQLLTPMTVALLAEFEFAKTPEAAFLNLEQTTQQPMKRFAEFALDFIAQITGTMLWPIHNKEL